MKLPRAFPLTLRLAAVLAALTLLSACGGESATPAAAASPAFAPVAQAQAQALPQATAAAMATGAPAQAAAAPGGQVVQSHERGVFFDWRPVQAEARRRGEASRPTAGQLQRANIVDNSGFGQAMPALSIDVPAGWQPRGGIEWHRQVECLGNTWAPRWSAASADGLHEVTLLPRMAWQVQSGSIVPMNPCPAAAMDSVQAYLTQVAGAARPGAQVLAFRDRPDISGPLQQALTPGQARVSVQAGELLVGYSLQGQPMRETLIAAVTFSDLGGNIQASADIGLALRAPDGLLDMALAERMRASLRYEQAWGHQLMAWSRQHVEAVNQRQVQSIQAWHQRRMSEISLAGMTARHQIRMDTIAQVGRINQQIVADRSASGERMHAQTIDMIQEVQPWRDPGTGAQVDLSIHYSQAWQLSDGRQFLTNDAGFEPGRDLGIAGHRLQPMR